MPRRLRKNLKREPYPSWLAETLRTNKFPPLPVDDADPARRDLIWWKYFATDVHCAKARRDLGLTPAAGRIGRI